MQKSSFDMHSAAALYVLQVSCTLFWWTFSNNN